MGHIYLYIYICVYVCIRYTEVDSVLKSMYVDLGAYVHTRRCGCSLRRRQPQQQRREQTPEASHDVLGTCKPPNS